jgi:hypothetical protein
MEMSWPAIRPNINIKNNSIAAKHRRRTTQPHDTEDFQCCGLRAIDKTTGGKETEMEWEEFKGWTSKGAVFLAQAEVEKRL